MLMFTYKNVESCFYEKKRSSNVTYEIIYEAERYMEGRYMISKAFASLNHQGDRFLPSTFHDTTIYYM